MVVIMLSSTVMVDVLDRIPDRLHRHTDLLLGLFRRLPQRLSLLFLHNLRHQPFLRQQRKRNDNVDLFLLPPSKEGGFFICVYSCIC